jgi:hypothetical protein
MNFIVASFVLNTFEVITFEQRMRDCLKITYIKPEN